MLRHGKCLVNLKEGLDHMEYRFEAVSQVWKTKGMLEKANLLANELSSEGWRLKDMRQGWSGVMFCTLYLCFERG